MACRIFRRRQFVVTLILMLLAVQFPAISQGAETTRLYIGHSARLTAQVPADWTMKPESMTDLSGNDGFVVSHALSGSSLDEVCALSGPESSDLVETIWSGRPACSFTAQYEGVAAKTLIVTHPHPFAIDDVTYDFAFITADTAHFDAIVASMSFSPDKVSPKAFVLSVLELVESSAYVSAQINWPDVRASALRNIELAPTMDMARAILSDLLQTLRLAGDRHSLLRLSGTPNFLQETQGYGFLIAGQRVILVFENSPAANAGIQTGDFIETINGHPPVAPGYLADPYYSLHASAVTLVLTRQDDQARRTVTLSAAAYEFYAPPSGALQQDRFGYLAVPEFRMFGREQEFVTTAAGIIESQQASKPCGWIVDLRANLGGSYLPMIGAISPLLSNGPFTGWQFADGQTRIVRYENGKVFDNDRAMADYSSIIGPEITPAPPVAVLISGATGSSGEATTLAFIDRPSTRLFGETTDGFTTANRGYRLFDGSMFFLSNAAMIDRNGTTYLDGIPPDEPIAIDWNAYGTASDPVLIAAESWLAKQPGCAS